MIAAVNSKARYGELLRQLLGVQDKPVECLIITHNNETLINSLHAAFGETSAAVLDVPQDQWTMDGGDLHHAILWAIRENGLKRLIVVGDSSAFPRTRLTKHHEAGNCRDTLSLAQAANASRKEAQEHFRHQLIELHNSAEIVQAVSAHHTEIIGLFYRAEAGTLAAYNAKTDAFELLVW